MSAGAEVAIVVVGSILASLVLGGATWAWRWWRRPVLEIYSGSGPEFDKRIGSTDSFASIAVEHHRLDGAYAKYLCVREVRGRSPARNVGAVIKHIKPPPLHYPDTELNWSGGERTVTIQPNGRQYLRVQAVYLWSDEGLRGTRQTPIVLEHAQHVEFTVELIIDGDRQSGVRFRMLKPWPHELVDVITEAEWPPTHIPYPTITKVTR